MGQNTHYTYIQPLNQTLLDGLIANREVIDA